MKIEEAKAEYGLGKAILKEDLKLYTDTKSENTFNQTLSNLVKFGIINRIENGIYYFPYEDEHFKSLEPTVKDIINIKYLNNYSGIRTGAFLIYKYKLTDQVSSYYEVITNNVSKNTRGKKEFDGKAIIKASKFEINSENIIYLEFLELIKNIQYSDYSLQETTKKLIEIFKDENLDKDKIRKLAKYYGGYVNKGLKAILEDIINESA